MKSITIHNLDDKLALITEEAKKNKESYNSTIKKLLNKSFGLLNNDDKKKGLSDLSGVWKKEDTKEFTNKKKPSKEIKP
jgi:hypothetical protein